MGKVFDKDKFQEENIQKFLVQYKRAGWVKSSRRWFTTASETNELLANLQQGRTPVYMSGTVTLEPLIELIIEVHNINRKEYELNPEQ